MTKTRILAFLAIALTVAAAALPVVEPIIKSLAPSWNQDLSSAVSSLIAALLSLISAFPISHQRRSMLYGDVSANNVDVPADMYPALWKVLSWIFSLIFKKK